MSSAFEIETAYCKVAHLLATSPHPAESVPLGSTKISAPNSKKVLKN
jgi:hypothetical protein